MKNDKKIKIGKNFGNKLIKQLYKEKEIISVTIVGSFAKSYNLNKIGDLDIVIICKKISPNLIKKSKNKIKKLKSKCSEIKRTLKINDTFGPVKFDAKKYFTVHLMFYDIVGHKQHAINSPFTCFDWQRSNWFIGKRMQEIFPVKNIYLRDFFEARRSSNEYLRDLKNNNISIRKFQIKKNKVFLVRKNYKINKKNRGEFVYHIISNLINNYNKFDTNKNSHISKSKFNRLFLKITKNNTYLLNEFKKIKKQKINLKDRYSAKSIVLAERFLKYFNLFLDNESKKFSKIVFLRHAKTKLNDGTFLGQGRNPDILKIKSNIKFTEKYNFIFSSPLKRALSTAEFFKKKKIIINEYLNEINYGKAEGLTINQYTKNFPKKINMWKKFVDVKFPQGENMNDVKKRVDKFIKKEVINKLSRKNFFIALVVTHNVFLRCLVGHFLDIKVRDYFKIKIKHLQKFEFILKNNKIYPNFKREDFKQLFASLYD